jgi:hypothetical protein
MVVMRKIPAENRVFTTAIEVKTAPIAEQRLISEGFTTSDADSTGGMRPNSHRTSSITPAFRTVAGSNTFLHFSCVDPIDKDSATGMVLQQFRVARVIRREAPPDDDVGVGIPDSSGRISAINHDSRMPILTGHAILDTYPLKAIGVLQGIHHDAMPSKSGDPAVSNGQTRETCGTVPISIASNTISVISLNGLQIQVGDGHPRGFANQYAGFSIRHQCCATSRITRDHNRF